jgi:hypothetical protein
MLWKINLKYLGVNLQLVKKNAIFTKSDSKWMVAFFGLDQR